MTCAALVALLASPLSLLAQDRYSIPADPKLKYSTPIAPGVAVPDKLESSIGTLNLSYGYPSAETVEKIYDNLDRSRALQAYLMAIPIVNQAGMRDSIGQFGPVNQTDVIWENLVDPRTVELTANDNTIYNFIWTNTHAGPLVVEIPPKVLGLIDDFWYRWVADVGITGADKGEGGKYLILPPGYIGEVPKGYFVVRPSTHGNWLVFRAFVVDGSTKPGVESVKKHLEDLSAGRCGQPAHHEVRQRLGHSSELRGARGLCVLGSAEPSDPGRTQRGQRSDHAWSVCLHRHSEGQALQSG
jgi:hypothetical protein